MKTNEKMNLDYESAKMHPDVFRKKLTTKQKIQKFLKYFERQRITPYLKKNIKEYYKELFKEELQEEKK